MSKNPPPKKRLGRGLDSLIGKSPGQSTADFESPFQTMSVERIDTTRQPRTDFDEDALQELADSIRESGILQPLVVRKADAGRVTLIAGERRLRAAKAAGLDSVPVVIRDVTEREAFALALVENVQRQDLGPIEEAEAFRYLIDDQGYSQSEVAKKVGFSRSAVANTVRLLRLPPGVQRMVADGDLSAGHGRAILALPAEEMRSALAERILTEGLSVRQSEELTRDIAQELLREDEAAAAQKNREKTRDDKDGDSSEETGEKRLRAQLQEVTDRLRRHLRVRVVLKEKLDGGGSLTVHYASSDELSDIVDRILHKE